MSALKRCAHYFPALLVFILAIPAVRAQKPPIEITADLSDAPRKLFHAEIDFPVSAGPLTLISPEWIPGHHMPSGPASSIVGVVFTANGKSLDWRRDDVSLFESVVGELRANQSHALAHDRLRETALLDRVCVVLADGSEAAVERFLRGLFENHGNAGVDVIHCDAAAHGAGADYGCLADFAYRRVFR